MAHSEYSANVLLNKLASLNVPPDIEDIMINFSWPNYIGFLNVLGDSTDVQEYSNKY
jgi:hypothetical protein